jgi:hypothetical protein
VSFSSPTAPHKSVFNLIALRTNHFRRRAPTLRGASSRAHFEALNAHLLESCRKRLADRLRGHDGTIGERLEHDLAAFQKPLPAPYDACDKKPGSVNSLSLVR